MLGNALGAWRSQNNGPKSIISTPHQQTPIYIKSCSRIAKIMLLSGMDGPFWSGHFNPFTSFFSTMDLDSDYYSSRCEDINK